MRNIIILVFLSLSSNAEAREIYKIPRGRFLVTGLDTNGSIILTRDTIKYGRPTGHNFIDFLPRHRFIDWKQPVCGIDISWKKTGTYLVSKKKLFMIYSGGKLTDAMEGNTKLTYVRGRIIYHLVIRNKDTMDLKKISGTTTRKVKRIK